MPSIESIKKWATKRLMVGIPVTGLVRYEWVQARYGQTIPANWGQVEMTYWLDPYSPFEFWVADARNVIVDKFVREGMEWLLFIDHDVCLCPGFLIRANERMIAEEIPVWSGLYFTKSLPSEPLVYRGRGNGYFAKWKLGDQIWVDGLPMGATLIHRSVLKVMWDESEEYTLQQGVSARRVFREPQDLVYDPETQGWHSVTGTEDLAWCQRVIDDKIFKKAGWPTYQRKKYPFMVDTGLFCRHIDPSGTKYPMAGEEGEFNG